VSGLHEQTVVVDTADGLVISPLVEGDRGVYTALRWENRAEIESALVFPPVELHEAFDDELRRIQEGHCRSGIRLDDRLVGQISLSPQWSTDRALELTMDLWVDKDHRRQHIAERASRALLAAAFAADADVTHVCIPIARQNTASKRLATKLGALRGGLDEIGEVEMWRLKRAAV
jgi:RimJ/RimL family protein N-acetyltransferase